MATTTVPDALREIAELRRQLLELQTESRANTAAVGAAIRKTRLALATVEQNEAILRLRPSTAPLIWDPRAGEMSSPELSQSLIDRLRRGDPVSNSLGGTGLYVGQPNLLLDPSLDTALFSGAFPTSSWATAAADFKVRTTILQGSNPGTHNYENAGPHARQSGEYASAPLMGTVASIGASCTFRDDWYFTGGGSLSGGALDTTAPLPFLVAALRFVRLTPAAAPLPSALTGTLEIHGDPVDGTGTIVATASWNLLEYGAGAAVQLVVAAITEDMAGYSTYGAKFRLLDEAASSTVLTYRLYEPQVHYAFTPDPIPFSPAIARWNPTWLDSRYNQLTTDEVLAARLSGDSNTRFAMDADGRMTWGPGNDTVDAALARIGAGVLGYESDLIAYDDSTWALTYNGDGTLDTAVRGGEQGTANVTVGYSAPGKVSSVVTTKGGRTITVTPTYTGDQVTGVSRAVT